MEKTTESTGRVLTMRELADELGVSYWTIWRWQREGKIPTIRLGRKLFFRLAAVEARLTAMEAESLRA